MTDWWERIRNLEPARVRAVWAAIAVLIVSLGFSVSTDLNAGVEATIVLVFTLIPLIQGETTRAKVTPMFKVEEAAKLADMEAEMDRQVALQKEEGLEFSDELGHGDIPEQLPGE
jgi:hypothetical protein